MSTAEKTICPICSGKKDSRSRKCRSCAVKEPETKVCNGCQNPFPLESYALRNNGRGGYKRRSRCKECERKQDFFYRKNRDEEKIRQHKERRRRAGWRELGLDPEEIRHVFENHSGKCDICQMKNKGKNLATDHCHATGLFRGFLCDKCNRGIGIFQDNPETMIKAVEYLKAFMSKSGDREEREGV